MTDTQRSIAACMASFAEFQRAIQNSLEQGHDAKIRLHVQIARGRVLNTQVAVNKDFKPCDDPGGRADEQTVTAGVAHAKSMFDPWYTDLANAIAGRLDGWLRLMIAVEGGKVLAGNVNPSFDIKPS